MLRMLPDRSAETTNEFPHRELSEGTEVRIRFHNEMSISGRVRSAHDNWIIVWDFPSTIWAEDVDEFEIIRGKK